MDDLSNDNINLYKYLIIGYLISKRLNKNLNMRDILALGVIYIEVRDMLLNDTQ